MAEVAGLLEPDHLTDGTDDCGEGLVAVCLRSARGVADTRPFGGPGGVPVGNSCCKTVKTGYSYTP